MLAGCGDCRPQLLLIFLLLSRVRKPITTNTIPTAKLTITDPTTTKPTTVKAAATKHSTAKATTTMPSAQILCLCFAALRLGVFLCFPCSTSHVKSDLSSACGIPFANLKLENISGHGRSAEGRRRLMYCSQQGGKCSQPAHIPPRCPHLFLALPVKNMLAHHFSFFAEPQKVARPPIFLFR